MSIQIPNGAVIALASGYASAIAVSAITNASPAVATTATNTYAIGDFIEVTSAWSRLNSKIVRLSAAASTSATFESIDTTSTTIYPAGLGAGSVRKITGWTNLSQVVNSSGVGGDQQFLDYQFLESDSMRRIPTVKNSAGLNLTIADDPTLAGYILAAAANDDRLPRAVRITLPNGGILVYNCYVSLNRSPDMTVNQLMTVPVTLSLLADVVRY